MSKPSPPHTRAGKRYTSKEPSFTPPSDTTSNPGKTLLDVADEEARLLIDATKKAEIAAATAGGGAGAGHGRGAHVVPADFAPTGAAVRDARAQAAQMRAEMRAKRKASQVAAYTPPKSHLVKTPFGPMDPVGWASMQQMRSELSVAHANNVRMAKQHAALKRNLRNVCMERDRSVKDQKAMQQKLQSARARDAARTQLDDRKYYAAIDNKGFKAIYAQFGVNGRSDEGSAPLFAQVHLRHMSGEQRQFHGAGCCMNAEQFFNMVTHIPNVVEVLQKDMGVKVPKHILPVLALLNGDDDMASANAGSE